MEALQSTGLPRLDCCYLSCRKTFIQLNITFGSWAARARYWEEGGGEEKGSRSRKGEEEKVIMGREGREDIEEFKIDRGVAGGSKE